MTGGRRDDLVMHGHGGLDQPGDTRGRLRVADVALDGADRGGRPGGTGGAAGLAEGPQLGGVTDRGAGAVPLQVPDGADVESRQPIGAAERQPVPGRLRPRDAALAVGGVPPPGDRRVDPQSPRFRVVLPHQHEHAAALPRPEAVGVPVVDPHLAGGERAGLGEPDDLERVDAQVDAAGHRRVGWLVAERGARGHHRQQG